MLTPANERILDMEFFIIPEEDMILEKATAIFMKEVSAGIYLLFIHYLPSSELKQAQQYQIPIVKFLLIFTLGKHFYFQIQFLLPVISRLHICHAIPPTIQAGG